MTEIDKSAHGARCFKASFHVTFTGVTFPRRLNIQLRQPTSVESDHTKAYTHKSSGLRTKRNTAAAASSLTAVLRRAMGLNSSSPIKHQSRLTRQLTLIIVRFREMIFSSPAMKKTYTSQTSSVTPATRRCIFQMAEKVRLRSSRSSRTRAISRGP